MINCLNNAFVSFKPSSKMFLNLPRKGCALSNKCITVKSYECNSKNKEIRERYNRFVSDFQGCQTMFRQNQSHNRFLKINSLLSVRRQKVRESRFLLLQKKAAQFIESFQHAEKKLSDQSRARSNFNPEKHTTKYTFSHKTKTDKDSKDICKVFVSTLMQDGRKLRYQRILRHALSL